MGWRMWLKYERDNCVEDKSEKRFEKESECIDRIGSLGKYVVLCDVLGWRLIDSSDRIIGWLIRRESICHAPQTTSDICIGRGDLKGRGL